MPKGDKLVIFDFDSITETSTNNWFGCDYDSADCDCNTWCDNCDQTYEQYLEEQAKKAIPVDNPCNKILADRAKNCCR